MNIILTIINIANNAARNLTNIQYFQPHDVNTSRPAANFDQITILQNCVFPSGDKLLIALIQQN